tara:strand:+ start:50 stop:634 length:585 start_codon:yes stop_codon:yes gene_type:complete
MPIYSFKGFKPIIKSSSFIHPTASVIGDVHIGENVYVGPGAAIRGDWGTIVIEDGCNIQENCIIHMFPGITVTLKKGAHIGHGAVLHGVTIGENCLIGMNAVLMDEVILEKECIVGALSFVKAKSIFEKRSLIVGNPAKKIKTISDEMIDWKTEGTKLYQQLPKECYESLEICEPLRTIDENRPEHSKNYKTWK